MAKIQKYIYLRINRLGNRQYYFCDTFLSEAGMKRIPNKYWVNEDDLESYAEEHNYSLKGKLNPFYKKYSNLLS